MSTVEQRLERVAAFFRLPYRPYDPVATVAAEGEGTWRRLTLATWLMMFASLVATAVVTRDVLLTTILAVLLAAALRVSYVLHFRTTSRLLVNWITFGAAFITGPIFLARYWPLRHGLAAGDNLEGMGFLILCFMWITAFRAFALRTTRDLVETILPCGSIILLALVVSPTPLVLGCMALTVMGVLALLASQHRLEAGPKTHPVSHIVRSHHSQRAGAFYSWPALYVLVLIAAVFIAWGAARSELAGTWADTLRFVLARQVARWMQPRDNALLPEPSVLLARLDTWPNTDRPVFNVVTKHPGNTRVGAYHRYTGVWWQQNLRGHHKAATGRGVWTLPMEGSGASRRGATRIVQVYTARKALVSTLPALFCPVSVEVHQRRVRFDRDHVIRIPHIIRPGDSYTVVSYIQPVVPTPRPGVGIAADERAADLELPDSLPQRVRDLAVQITREARTPYDKVHAIEQHLMYGYRYTLSAPTGYPADFVDYFLFESKRGFCMHFGSAMVVMCRAIGLPARLASGFIAGEEDPKNPDHYTVREKDAHAWPEVYFDGAGWTAFEPTPPADSEESGLARAWRQIVEGTQSGALALYTLMRRYLKTSVVLLLVAIVALSLAHARVRQAHLRGWRGQEPLTRIVRAYLNMRRLLVDHGMPDTQTIAPRELLASLPEPLAHVRQEAEVLTENYLQARFGRQRPAPAQASAAEEQVAVLRRLIRRKPSTAPRDKSWRLRRAPRRDDL